VTSMVAESGTGITWWAVASAFGGTIIGAVLGGLVSFWLQRKSLASTKALRDADRREVRKALGYALFFKMIRLSSDLAQLGQPVADAVEKAKHDGRGELWPVVLPTAPLPDPIKFSPGEMALVLSLDNGLFNDMAALDDLHKSTVALFRFYGEMRNALTATLHPVEMVGQVGSTVLTKEERERMQPRSVELDVLVRGMIERTQQDGKIAWECLGRLHGVLEKEFDLKHKLELKDKYRMGDRATRDPVPEGSQRGLGTTARDRGQVDAHGERGAASEPAKSQKYYHHYKR
jgi:hypothetical protein